MTCVYNATFATIWTSAVVSIPLALGLAIWLVVTLTSADGNYGSNRAERIVLLALAVLTLVAWTIYARLHATRVLIRAGAFPNVCRGDAFPHDELEFRQAVIDLRRKHGKYPAIVGSGWGFFLQRRGPTAPRIFTMRFTGALSNNRNSRRFYAGTTIEAVNRLLKRENLTLPSHPTMDYITIGSWAACSNHGNDGDAQTTSAIERVTVLDMRDDTTTSLSHADTQRLFDSDFAGRYCVLDVTFNAVEDRIVQKRGILVRDAQSAADWLAPGAVLRLLFLGEARDYAIGLRWEKPYDDDPHFDPHVCSRMCQFLQVDVLSVCGGCHEPMSKFNSKSTLYEANRWTPAILPIMNLGLLCTSLLNFEIFFSLDAPLDGNTLFRLVEAAISMHKKLGGRSEVRYGAPSARTIVFWDISLVESAHGAPFQLLHDAFGVEKVAIHTGKFLVRDVAPCTRVAASELNVV